MQSCIPVYLFDSDDVVHGLGRIRAGMDGLQALLTPANGQGEDDDLGFNAAQDIHQPSLSGAADARPGTFLLALTFAAGISGLLFGCKSHEAQAVLGQLDWGIQD